MICVRHEYDKIAGVFDKLPKVFFEKLESESMKQGLELSNNGTINSFAVFEEALCAIGQLQVPTNFLQGVPNNFEEGVPTHFNSECQSPNGGTDESGCNCYKLDKYRWVDSKKF